MLRTSLAALGTATVCLVSVWAVAASAGPVSPGSAAVVGGTVIGGMSLVEQVHGCHRGILRDWNGLREGYTGWHFHDRHCLRHDVAPPGFVNGPGYRGSDLNPRCSYQCRFVGPIKQCHQVCR